MLRTVIIVFMFALFFKLSQCMQCYFCNADMTGTRRPRLCQKFDGTEKYMIDCPHSTMCFKKLVKLDMPNGLSTTSVVRGCASQTLDGEQEKINGKYAYVDRIHEVYDEGCSVDARDGLSTTTTHCYCRGDLCNAAGNNTYIGLLLLWLPFLGRVFS